MTPTRLLPPEAELGQLRLAADFDLLPRVHGEATVTGVIRREPQDFSVREELPFTPVGEGEHLYLRLRKTGENTRWVAKRLAEAAGLGYGSVGYAGLKDRRAVTEQWFSLHLPGRADPELPPIEGVEILERVRHTGKLRTGAVAANHFRLVIRDLGGELASLGPRLDSIRQRGVPNYFGPQRFGHDGSNLSMLAGSGRLNRETRSLGLSALRSALFNGYLAMRLVQGSWDRLLDGEIRARGDAFGQTSGLLWGSGENRSTGESLAGETAWFDLFPGCRAVLEQQRTRMMRRALAVIPGDLAWQAADGRAELSFWLPKGSYATMVLRELGHFTVADSTASGGD